MHSDTVVPQIPLRILMSIDEAYMERARDAAHRLAGAERYADAEIICRGLIAADPTDRWPHRLYVAILFRAGRPGEALQRLDEALGHHPGDVELEQTRRNLVQVLAFLEGNRTENV